VHVEVGVEGRLLAAASAAPPAVGVEPPVVVAEPQAVDPPVGSARLCGELGADIVKVNWSGDAASFEEIIRACERPVVLAGGTLISDEALLNRMEQAREAGAVLRGQLAP